MAEPHTFHDDAWMEYPNPPRGGGWCQEEGCGLHISDPVHKSVEAHEPHAFVGADGDESCRKKDGWYAVCGRPRSDELHSARALLDRWVDQTMDIPAPGWMKLQCCGRMVPDGHTEECDAHRRRAADGANRRVTGFTYPEQHEEDWLGDSSSCVEPGCEACKVVGWVRAHLGMLCPWQVRTIHDVVKHTCDHPGKA